MTCKRVCVQHTTGYRKGLIQILGTTDKDVTEAHYLAEVDFIDHKAPCGLSKVTTRYILYREIEPVPQEKIA